MIFDRALADAETPSNLLIQMTGDDQIHDLALPQRQTGDAFRGRRDDLIHGLAFSRRQTIYKRGLGFSPAGWFAGIPAPLQRASCARATR